ncbi:LysR family cys regulon transcriptional activator|uniref:LysR family cys regulon transcriptional activator n=1 Tax=Brenneria salicis ATCC 15712 = DSM 30166 TaxID=714314 RepID=A0A366HYJ4_9GAMM|nr:HTH-type transcriptional regulator Cbl [Brenneria salicis]NMN92032.1 LysR family cys regulon transcriptional activator [Brenneria salicis ATCC 15712 = DSM 30166]RBP59109.1 LysR family cys regulon transcriptional activator [Brenneria salicis ATCC 15712 = DSM 30166]RLM29685.1 transcriptional regulator Cbl [Brenneria salicis ATCC 15712 = DSM 30166]
MNFQQLKIIRESARCNYNLTEVANTLFTSQSGVSRHIRELEEELGIEIFIRRGKRLLGMTEPGKELLVVAERILNDASNIRRLANVFSNNEIGQLVIATTHTQARYSLPLVIKEFRVLYPQVRLVLNQGTPDDIVAMLYSGEADIGIASERLINDAALTTFPYYRWHHSVIVPENHPLTKEPLLTLEKLNTMPLITYRQGITGRSRLDEAFQAAGMSPDITLSAQDSDVIKTYVELGLGVGIVAHHAYDPMRDKGLVRLNAEHLFAANMVWLGLKKYQLQRNYTLKFIQLCNRELGLSDIKERVFAENDDTVIDYQI